MNLDDLDGKNAMASAGVLVLSGSKDLSINLAELEHRMRFFASPDSDLFQPSYEFPAIQIVLESQRLALDDATSAVCHRSQAHTVTERPKCLTERSLYGRGGTIRARGRPDHRLVRLSFRTRAGNALEKIEDL